jgi:hypothetical protein
MKRQSLFVIFILSLLAAVNISCSKEKFKPVTINGQTFGCQVNGKPFIPDKWDYGNNIPPVRIDFGYSPVLVKTEVQIIGKKENQYVEVWIESPVVEGRVYLNTTTLPFPLVTHPSSYGLYYQQNPEKTYITNSIAGGFVDIISIDTISKKIEGRFEFVGTDQSTGNIISVTYGYFKRN